MSGPHYLLSKGLDPILGVLTGILAYRLSESNPRTAPPPGETLGELVKWKYQGWKASREVGQKEEPNWEEVVQNIAKEKE
ncbi:hypothetical protein FRC04_009316 [Tulasnella sp. 424]|nr:hypothetical protein FRC04_009316 [Tulasnella sp. 424]KAG8974983.1 hypothetical protein FRC05_006660 [Tulasnella sp. 425]